MSMYEMEDFAEYAVALAARSDLEPSIKKGVIRAIYEMESYGDCSFTQLRNMDDLIETGYTVLIEKSDLPASLRDGAYEDLSGEHWCVDTGTDAWKKLVASGKVTGLAAVEPAPIGQGEALKIVLSRADRLDDKLLEGAMMTVCMSNAIDEMTDMEFELFFHISKDELLSMDD